MDGSPASKCLKPSDRIMSVNGQSTQGLTQAELIRLIQQSDTTLEMDIIPAEAIAAAIASAGGNTAGGNVSGGPTAAAAAAAAAAVPALSVTAPTASATSASAASASAAAASGPTDGLASRVFAPAMKTRSNNAAESSDEDLDDFADVETIMLKRGEDGYGFRIIGPDKDGDPAGVYVSGVTQRPATDSNLKEGHRIVKVRGPQQDWLDTTNAMRATVVDAVKNSGEFLLLGVKMDLPGYSKYDKKDGQQSQQQQQQQQQQQDKTAKRKSLLGSLFGGGKAEGDTRRHSFTDADKKSNRNSTHF